MPLDKTHFEHVPLATVRKIVQAESEKAALAERPVPTPLVIEHPAAKPSVKRVRS